MNWKQAKVREPSKGIVQSTRMYDHVVETIIHKNQFGRGISWYIMAAYAYYVDDNPIVSDSSFDRLAKYLLANWDKFEHDKKRYLDRGSLRAQTYLQAYPISIINALGQIRKDGVMSEQ